MDGSSECFAKQTRDVIIFMQPSRPKYTWDNRKQVTVTELDNFNSDQNNFMGRKKSTESDWQLGQGLRLLW